MKLDFSDFGQQMPLPEAFLEGAAAHKAGTPFQLNPYNHDISSESRDEWSAGWQDAEYSEEYWNEVTTTENDS